VFEKIFSFENFNDCRAKSGYRVSYVKKNASTNENSPALIVIHMRGMCWTGVLCTRLIAKINHNRQIPVRHIKKNALNCWIVQQFETKKQNFRREFHACLPKRRRSQEFHERKYHYLELMYRIFWL